MILLKHKIINLINHTILKLVQLEFKKIVIFKIQDQAKDFIINLKIILCEKSIFNLI